MLPAGNGVNNAIPFHLSRRISIRQGRLCTSSLCVSDGGESGDAKDALIRFLKNRQPGLTTAGDPGAR